MLPSFSNGFSEQPSVLIQALSHIGISLRGNARVNPFRIGAVGFLRSCCAKSFVFVLLAVGWLQTQPARASGDLGCSVSWTLNQAHWTGKQTDDRHISLNECNNQPFLSPSNDSRVNLQLLLLDAGRSKIRLPTQSESAQPPSPTPFYASASPFTLEDFTSLFGPSETSAPAEDGLARGEGSRCRSNAMGANEFQAALNDSDALPAVERTLLSESRNALRANCGGTTEVAASSPSGSIRSALGQQFAAYLTGAAAFYRGDYDLARQSFASLGNSSQPWLKQTSRYMLGRVELNRAQANAFGLYGELSLDKVDAKALAAAETAFQAYLLSYPTGAYTASARGLLRRVDWLGGQPQKLEAEYAWQFAHQDPALRNVSEAELVQEVDSKLFAKVDPTVIKEPLLLATFDLMHMRSPDSASGPQPIALAVLEAQKPVFTGHEALFDYLLAAHAFYDEGDPAGTLSHLPAATPNQSMTYLEFSRQVLRGLALEAAKDKTHARELWLQLLPVAQQPLQRPTLELALAMNYECSDALAEVFAADSPIHDRAVREILLRNDAGPILLRQRVKAADGSEHERHIALFVLLYKELTRSRYQEFLNDLAPIPADSPAKVDAKGGLGPEPNIALFNWPGYNANYRLGEDPDFAMFNWPGEHGGGYACPPLREVARTLARDPHAARGLICLAEFVRLNGLDLFGLDIKPPPDELGGAALQFPGSAFSRLETYRQLLGNAKTPPPERAYALYRAVNCYAPAHNNGCGGRDVPLSQRKQWFHALKTDFASSPWAVALKYYW
jgi:hypothetical protein